MAHTRRRLSCTALSCPPSSYHPRLSASALAASVLVTLMAGPAMAQSQTASPAPTEAAAGLPTVTVVAPAAREARASISGLADAPAWKAPVQALRITQDVLKDQQVQRLADLVKLDASTSDAYNTTGYWDYLSMRGFTLDNAYNYRREGLPINAETRIALDNKAAVELLKGTSGIQAGVSAPGGLVNLLVKRPEGRVRTAEIGFTGGSSVMAAVDIGDRFGTDQRFGLRVNAAAEKLDPSIDNARGHRRLLAVATDWVIAPGSVIEAEFEHSLYRQPSVPGFSLLGNALPSANDIDPSRNLNNQPWAQPVEMAGNTGTLRWKQDWADGWRSVVTYGEQHLRSQDRAAFPYGCSSEGAYDRYCSDGTFDLSDYRSEHERRLTRALNAQLRGDISTGSIKHALSVGLLRSTHTTDLNNSAFNYVGTGNIGGNYGAYDPSVDPAFPGVDRHERSTELSISDSITFSEQWSAWAGLRHTWLKREVALTDLSTLGASLDQQVTTPWVALGYTLAPRTQVYASWGEGFEARTALSPSPLTPYTNAPSALPVHKSRQVELGIKAQLEHLQWGANLFRIQRPEAGPVTDTVSGDTSYVFDGKAVHQGAEAFVQTQHGAWTFNGSAMVLDAKREGSQSYDGKRPINVPEHTLKLSSSYRWAWTLPVTAMADVVHEGRRWVDPDNTVRLPSWTRVDVGLKAQQRVDGSNLTWRLGVSNLFDKRAWRESPTLTGHLYLFPMAERTVTGSLQVDF